MIENRLLPRFIGFFASLLLTFCAFCIVLWPNFFHFERETNLTLLFILAIVQGIVQSIFFLNVASERRPHWNLIFFASTLTMIMVIIFFSIWIMNHLDYNMSLT